MNDVYLQGAKAWRLTGGRPGGVDARGRRVCHFLLLPRLWSCSSSSYLLVALWSCSSSSYLLLHLAPRPPRLCVPFLVHLPPAPGSLAPVLPVLPAPLAAPAFLVWLPPLPPRPPTLLLAATAAIGVLLGGRRHCGARRRQRWSGGGDSGGASTPSAHETRWGGSGRARLPDWLRRRLAAACSSCARKVAASTAKGRGRRLVAAVTRASAARSATRERIAAARGSMFEPAQLRRQKERKDRKTGRARRGARAAEKREGKMGR